MCKQLKSMCTLFIFIGFSTVFGQKLKPGVFATLSGYRHTSFEDDLFVDFEIGLSASSTFWITPKISYKNSGGELNNQTIFQKDSAPLRVEEELRISYSGNIFGVGAEIRLTKQEDFWLFFWPRYYIGNFKFRGEYLSLNENDDFVYKEVVRENSFESYFDFSLGYSGYIDDAERLSASVFITYTTMDLKKGFEDLDFKETEIGPASANTQALGLGFMVEYRLW